MCENTRTGLENICRSEYAEPVVERLWECVTYLEVAVRHLAIEANQARAERDVANAVNLVPTDPAAIAAAVAELEAEFPDEDQAAAEDPAEPAVWASSSEALDRYTAASAALGTPDPIQILPVAPSFERTDYTRYLPGVDETGRAAIWCTDCTVQEPIWTAAEETEMVVPISIAHYIGICDAHEREHHGAYDLPRGEFTRMAMRINPRPGDEERLARCAAEDAERTAADIAAAGDENEPYTEIHAANYPAEDEHPEDAPIVPQACARLRELLADETGRVPAGVPIVISEPATLLSEQGRADVAELLERDADAEQDRRQLAESCARYRTERDEARVILQRVRAQMENLEHHGVTMVNIFQVLNLLSPTGPDGNYEAPAERAAADDTEA
jgi:hypothetical protein